MTHFDAHMHLGFMANGEEVAAEARAAGTMLFANTVTPAEYEAVCARFAGFDNVVVGFGMHPWWVGEGAGGGVGVGGGGGGVGGIGGVGDVAGVSDIGSLAAALERANPEVIGEIGLDFGKRHLATRALQVDAFTTVSRWAGERGGKVISLHAVHAAGEVFDVLGRVGALESCTCIFHWFTGPSDLLKRAVQAGCLFSVGPRMLATGKGREYVKAIPAAQLLLETDAPPEQGQRYSFAELHAELERAAVGIAAIKGDGWHAEMRQAGSLFVSSRAGE